jgi:D-alanyl-D-alanine carboxypeptidase
MGSQSINPDAHEVVIVPPTADHPAPAVYATAAYLLDPVSGNTLYAYNPYLHLPMLSTTKLMTASLAVQSGNLDRLITITSAMEHEINQLSADSAIFGVKVGEIYSLRDLLYGLLFVSGNDAALVIAIALAGSVKAFVTEMNQEAQTLGMKDTHFANPHGLLESGQYSCAHDLAILGMHAMNLDVLHQMSSKKTYNINAGGKHGARELFNENQFLWWYPGVDGGKTGFDGVNDFIQVESANHNGKHLIAVVLHSNDWWTDMRDLMDYGFDNYTWVSPRDADANQSIPFDNLWYYFASDKKENTIPTSNNGRYYIYTGYSVTGSILTYFDSHSGLKNFGFPVKMPISVGGSLVKQNFQNATIQCDFSNNSCTVI